MPAHNIKAEQEMLYPPTVVLSLHLLQSFHSAQFMPICTLQINVSHCIIKKYVKFWR